MVSARSSSFQLILTFINYEVKAEASKSNEATNSGLCLEAGTLKGGMRNGGIGKWGNGSFFQYNLYT